MTDNPSDEARALWRAQPTETPPMTLANIHARAFQSRIRWRNGREYIAGVIAIAGCGWLALRVEPPLVRVGLVVMILGALVSMWQLSRRGSARALQPATAAQSLAFHRGQLVRQRDALRGVWWWYLAPHAPGVTLVILGQALAHPGRWGPAFAMLAIVTVTFTVIALLNLWGARRLQVQIDELDGLAPDVD